MRLRGLDFAFMPRLDKADRASTIVALAQQFAD
jgi:hypothetical protein